MNILIIVDDYLPNSTKIAAKMMHDLAIKYNELGHNVFVVTPDPYIDEVKNISNFDGVNVYRFKSGELKKSNKVKRAINESLLSFRAWSALKTDLQSTIKPDLVIYYSPSIFWGIFVHKIKRKFNIPSYLVLRDFFPQWVVDNGMLSAYSPITKYFRLFEKINYSAADVIGIQSPKNLEWFDNNTNTGKELELLYNWASLKPANYTLTTYRDKYNLKDKVIFFYGGNIGKAQDLMSIVKLAEDLKEEESAFFLIIGSGEEFSHIQKEIKKRNLSNLALHPSISQDEFRLFLTEIDVGLFTLDYNHNTHNFPGKLLGYMVESKPILGCINPGNDLRKLIESSFSGLISITGDDSQLRKNTLELLHNPNLRKEMGENSQKLLESVFSIDAAASQILNSVK